MSSGSGSIDDETKAFLVSEFDSLGSEAVVFGLEAVLMVEAGDIVHTGVTQDMRDGSAAAAVAQADFVAATLGHPHPDETQEVLDLVDVHRNELLEVSGLADLAARVLELVGDPMNVHFATSKGTFPTRDAFQTVVSEVRGRVALALVDHPGGWEQISTPGFAQVNHYPQGEDGADND